MRIKAASCCDYELIGVFTRSIYEIRLPYIGIPNAILPVRFHHSLELNELRDKLEVLVKELEKGYLGIYTVLTESGNTWYWGN